MKIVEIRVLGGPNVFLPVPAIKIEFAQVEESDLDTLADAVRHYGAYAHRAITLLATAPARL